MENQEYSLQELLSKAEKYCSRSERCAADVRRLLDRYGCSSEAADSVLLALYEQHYLDDTRYCDAYVHDKLLLQHWGKRKIRAMLAMSGLQNHPIESAISAIDSDQYTAVIRSLLQKKKSATREQQIRYLLQKGFDYSDINAVLSEG